MIKEKHADVAVIGGSLGGCAAALAAASMGRTVIMTEETEWIGGQLTSQGVPPDEHSWIETHGCTRRYRQFREGVRDYYRNHFPLTKAAHDNPLLNPGNGNVSPLCHEPRTALAVLLQMLAPYIHSGQVAILTQHVPLQVEMAGDRIVSVTARSSATGDNTVIAASCFLDATECGDLLPLAGAEYVTGSESMADTGEPHAIDGPAQPLDMQAFTYCFAMDYREGENHTISRPESYSFWRDFQPSFWPDRLLSWAGVRPSTLEPVRYNLFPGEPGLSYWKGFSLFTYRRLIDASLFRPGTYESDISLVNWPQNDYFLGPIIDVDDETRNRHLKMAKELSLSLLYWMQTEAPRPDGKAGYPGLRLRKDVFDTEDGLAKYPYVRESRRIQAEFTVLEQHIAKHSRPDGKAASFADSVGIGYYHIDLHPSSGNRSYIDFASLPFQIPLGSLLPVRLENLLPACKNIGTTHITNGGYRLHPVEWSIGEAAGLLAAFSLDRDVSPREVRNRQALLEDFQALLVRQGIDLSWPS